LYSAPQSRQAKIAAGAKRQLQISEIRNAHTLPHTPRTPQAAASPPTSGLHKNPPRNQNAPMTDQQILSELETQIGRKLPRIEYEATFITTNPGHAADEQGRIIGLNLDGLKTRTKYPKSAKICEICGFIIP